MDIRISGGRHHSDLLYIGKVVVPIIMMVEGDRLQYCHHHPHPRLLFLMNMMVMIMMMMTMMIM